MYSGSVFPSNHDVGKIGGSSQSSESDSTAPAKLCRPKQNGNVVGLLQQRVYPHVIGRRDVVQERNNSDRRQLRVEAFAAAILALTISCQTFSVLIQIEEWDVFFGEEVSR